MIIKKVWHRNCFDSRTKLSVSTFPRFKSPISNDSVHFIRLIYMRRYTILHVIIQQTTSTSTCSTAHTRTEIVISVSARYFTFLSTTHSSYRRPLVNINLHWLIFLLLLIVLYGTLLIQFYLFLCRILQMENRFNESTDFYANRIIIKVATDETGLQMTKIMLS